MPDRNGSFASMGTTVAGAAVFRPAQRPDPYGRLSATASAPIPATSSRAMNVTGAVTESAAINEIWIIGAPGQLMHHQIRIWALLLRPVGADAAGTQIRLRPMAGLLVLGHAGVELPAATHAAGLHGLGVLADRGRQRGACDGELRRCPGHEPVPFHPVDPAGPALAAPVGEFDQ